MAWKWYDLLKVITAWFAFFALGSLYVLAGRGGNISSASMFISFGVLLLLIFAITDFILIGYKDKWNQNWMKDWQWPDWLVFLRAVWGCLCVILWSVFVSTQWGLSAHDVGLRWGNSSVRFTYWVILFTLLVNYAVAGPAIEIWSPE